MKKTTSIMSIIFFVLYNYVFAQECIMVKENGMGDFNKEKELAWLGLAYCVGLDDKKAIENKLHTLSAHHKCYNYIQIMDANAVFEELKQYINKTKNIPERQWRSFEIFRSCMIMYDSKSYQDEVKRIVKKYCKDCK